MNILDLSTLLYILPMLPTAVVTFLVTRRWERKRMNSDDFVARAVAQAEAFNTQATGPGLADSRAGGIYVVGSNITIVTNVQNSEVTTPESGPGAVMRAREAQQV